MLMLRILSFGPLAGFHYCACVLVFRGYFRSARWRPLFTAHAGADAEVAPARPVGSAHAHSAVAGWLWLVWVELGDIRLVSLSPRWMAGRAATSGTADRPTGRHS
ncbi:Hypothetical predicted protein [Pelobates cultripes]|uniref:Uncharacterized protein n=1 Tax=Pelobates cultripes TaxID=61616 RepID=A0AAD1TCH8_PELCU|nr:Hypothetical predicted protein [Pelobates cultripes]